MIESGVFPKTRSAGGEQRIGVSLCGTGFRASLFHLGVLARLAELDLLRRVEVLSAVSGGAVVGALYYLYLKRELDAHGEVGVVRLMELIAEMERHVVAVTQMNLAWQAKASLRGGFDWGRNGAPSAERFGDLLDRHLYRPVWNGDKDRPVELREMAIHPRGDRDFNPVTDNAGRHCKVPALIIHATTLNTGHGWRFETDRMGEPARGRAQQQMNKNSRLTQSRYHGLAEVHAGMPLGRAVAASAAMPGLIAPLRLRHLYPKSDRRRGFLDVQLADGSLHDPLGTAVLIERGCSEILVSDGARQLVGQPFPGRNPVAVGARGREILLEQARARELARLDQTHPGRIVLLHLLRELDAPEATPVGPANFGHLAKDRGEKEPTSYGVERRVQAALATLRTDLDAFSEIEAFALMADGYLMTRRAFQRLGQQGKSWADVPALNHAAWRFSTIVEALRVPSSGLIKQLQAAGHRPLRGLMRMPRLWLELGVVVLTTALVLGAVATMLAPGLRELDPAIVTAISLAVVTITLASPLSRRFRGAAPATGKVAWLRRPFGWANSLGACALALPLCFFARWQLRADRRLLKAGELRRIGIEPRPSVMVKRRVADTDSAAPITADKAA